MFSFPRKYGAALPQWAQVTAFDAVSDPGAICTGATGVAADGLITFESIDTASPLVDGYQENIPIFQARLLDLVPEFDPAQDVLDVRLDIASMPLNAAKYGLAIFVADGPVSGRASWNAGGVQAYPNSATVVNGGIMGATAQGSVGTVGSNTNPTTKLMGRLWWHGEAAPTIRVTGQAQRSGVDEAPLVALGATGAAFAGALADWRLCVGLVHFAAVDQADNIVQARAYVRRVRAGDPFS